MLKIIFEKPQAPPLVSGHIVVGALKFYILDSIFDLLPPPPPPHLNIFADIYFPQLR
jgi:hypothetical protein